LADLSRPVPDSYWVLPGKFLAGGYPGLRQDEKGTYQRLAAFLKAGFNTFIDLTCAGERPPYLPLLLEQARAYDRAVTHRRFSFQDFDVPTHDMMAAALNDIDLALDEGRKVYLHCVGGIGRTGMTVGCYFQRHGMQPAQALLQMRELYRSAAQSQFVPTSPESERQVRFILNWKEDGLA
jgi:hypothetical protein